MCPKILLLGLLAIEDMEVLVEVMHTSRSFQFLDKFLLARILQAFDVSIQEKHLSLFGDHAISDRVHLS